MGYDEAEGNSGQISCEISWTIRGKGIDPESKRGWQCMVKLSTMRG